MSAVEPRFGDPPVREVTLSLMFEPLRGMQTLHLAPLRVEWNSDYPKLSELAPQPPWQGNDRTVFEIVGAGSNWPVPNCLFTNATGDRAVQLQHDRFSVSWRFDKQGSQYPGYVSLRDELTTKFARFVEVVSDALSEAPKVMRVDVEYSNVIGGVSPDQLALGLLAGWDSGAAPRRSADYVGLRLHHCVAEQDKRVGVIIGVDPEGALGGPDEETEVGSALTLDTQSDVAAGEDYLSRLDSSHDVLISAFLEVTTSEMKKSWGYQE